MYPNTLMLVDELNTTHSTADYDGPLQIITCNSHAIDLHFTQDKDTSIILLLVLWSWMMAKWYLRRIAFNSFYSLSVHCVIEMHWKHTCMCQ